MKKILFIIALLSIISMSCTGKAPAEGTIKEDQESAASAVKKAEIIHLSLADFRKKVADIDRNTAEWKYLGDKPAIIDFYADWCGPCKKIAPILEELANEYSGQIYIYKVDTDKEGELASLFSITAIPALLFVPMEGEPQMAKGLLPKKTLKQGIDELLLKK